MFLRINYELKMVVMLVAVVIYNVVILQTRSSLLDQFSNEPYPTDNLKRCRPSRFNTVLGVTGDGQLADWRFRLPVSDCWRSNVDFRVLTS